MRAKSGLYERAATGGVRSLWHAGSGGISIFAGALARNASHRHSVPVLLAGVYGRFQLRIGTGPWQMCRAAAVPAGVAYEFDMAGDVLAVIYLEPSVAGFDALLPLLAETRECGGGVVAETCDVSLVRELYEDQGSGAWAGTALHDAIGFTMHRARRQLDPRIGRTLAAMSDGGVGTCSAGEAASRAGLSASRFQHLFAAEVGVPYRRYRAWQRMLAAIREITSGASFTEAAHAAGYADQPHFAHDFRRMFGASATPSLSNARG